MSRKIARVRALAAAVLCLVCVGSDTAGAQFSSPATVSSSAGNAGVQGLAFDHQNLGVIWWDGGSLAYASTTTDGGATWSPRVLLPSDNLAMDSDAAGNRVWAYASGTTLRLQRTAPGGLPPANQSGSISIPSVAPKDISIQVTSDGDALVAWTSGYSDTHSKAYAVYWAHDQSAPGSAQELLDAPSGAYRPVVALDDAGKTAAILWYHNYVMRQAFAADVTQTAPFTVDAPIDNVGPGFLDQSAQTPDGRAVTTWTRTIQGGPHGQYFEQWAATRQPGERFTAPQFLEGNADKSSQLALAGGAALAPNGTGLLTYFTFDPVQQQKACPEQLGWVGVRGAAVEIPLDNTQPVSVAPFQLAGGVTTNATNPIRPAVGLDGRRAAAWEEQTDCGPNDDGSNRTVVFPVGFGAPGAGIAPIGNLPPEPLELAFRPDGALYAVYGDDFGDDDFKGVSYGGGGPIEGGDDDDDGGDDGGGGDTGGSGGTGGTSDTGGTPGTGGPGGPGTTTQPPSTNPVVVPVVSTGNVETRSGRAGRVEVTVDLSAPGNLAMDLLCRRLGFIQRGAVASAARYVRVARVRRTVRKPGKVTLTLKPNRRALKELRKRKRLAAKVVVTFKPKAGGATIKKTKSVTLRR